MTTSPYDAERPPEPARRPGGRRRERRRSSGGGRGEQPMVPEAQFSSYYGRAVVKPAPWSWEIPAYLFLGGVAGGSGVLAAGAAATGQDLLRRNTRLTALTAVGLSGAALVADLGKPMRFLNMLRTVKLTSPMSVGTWIFSGYAAGASLTAAAEVDRLAERIGLRLPLGGLLRALEVPGAAVAALLGPPLSAYTSVLLSDTATPTWYAARHDLPFVFVSSAMLASSGCALVTTPPGQTGAVRALAAAGTAVELAAMRRVEQGMEPEEAEPLRTGKPRLMLRASAVLSVAGSAGALLAGHRRPAAVLSGLALAAASALTRFAVFDAGIASAKDPRHTVAPQRRRLERRRAAGRTHDSITTAG